MRTVLLALITIALIAGSALCETGAAQTKTGLAPPAAFLAVVGGLAGTGFHIDTRLTDGGGPGYETVEPCASRWRPGSWHDAALCEGFDAAWRTSVVGDVRSGGEWPVQEVWALRYVSPDRAKAARAAMNDMTFRKHPYRTWIDGAVIYATEGRFRFHTLGKRLQRVVEGKLKAAFAAEAEAR